MPTSLQVPYAILKCLSLCFTAYSLLSPSIEQVGAHLTDGSLPIPSLPQDPLTPSGWAHALFDLKAFVVYNTWYAYCLAAWWILPGRWVDLPAGRTQKYKANACSTGILTFGITALWISYFGYDSFTFLYKHSVGLITAAFVMSVVQGLLWYTLSFTGDKVLALDGTSGNVLYDFLNGRELNPTVGSLDIKTFNALRPGCILWLLVDISMACEQATRRGGKITDAMGFVVLFQSLNIYDALCDESKIIATNKNPTRCLGFLLVAGDLLWVPFTYSLQARYLVFNHKELGPLFQTIIIAISAAGWFIYRQASNEKNNFEAGSGSNPDVQYIVMTSGDRRMVSGWWGVCRHPQYLGDLLVALSWALPTGLDTFLTYSSFFCSALELIDRQLREDNAGKRRNGKEWDEYTALVPFRIIPYVY